MTSITEDTLPALPLPNREEEFGGITRFAEERLQLAHSKALFVFGACGCGKTSTVLRSLRSFTDRPLPSDRQPRGGKRVGSVVEPAPTAQTLKRLKLERHAEEQSTTPTRASASSGARLSGTPSSAGKDSHASTEQEEEDFILSPFTPEYWAARHPTLYSATNRGQRRLQAYYINCADMSPQQLVNALQDNMKKAFPRPTGPTRDLMDAIAALPQRRKGESAAAAAVAVTPARALGAAGRIPPPMHIVALDEVENVRVAARATLSELATLSFALPSQLSLIFISNSRDLAHVPPMLLQELPFAPYSAPQLQSIAQAVVAHELALAEQEHHHSQLKAAVPKTAAVATKNASSSKVKGKGKGGAKTSTAASPPSSPLTALPTVSVSDSLLTFIARKALNDFSGDVRQVTALCRRVVATAYQELGAQATVAAASATGVKAYNRRKTTASSPAAAGTSALDSKLHAVVTAFGSTGVAPTDGTNSTRSSGELSAAAVGEERSSSDGRQQRRSSAAAASTTSGTSIRNEKGGSHGKAQQQQQQQRVMNMTLANSASVLTGSAVEHNVNRHISTLPEHALVVLCCLIVLTLRKERDEQRSRMAIGGTTNTTLSRVVKCATATPAIVARGSCAMALSEVRHLYVSFMNQHHFPSANAAAVGNAISHLADIGILTRPQKPKNGNEEVFSFHGTWTLEAMQTALGARGEAIRKEREAFGLGDTENKFVAVLRDLKQLVGYH